MFTGIIEAVGTLVAVEPKNGDLRLRVKTHDLDLFDVQLGDSIATNGVCLTVVDLPGDGYWADVSVETLGKKKKSTKLPNHPIPCLQNQRCQKTQIHSGFLSVFVFLSCFIGVPFWCKAL